MTIQEFKDTSRKWINHKLILAEKSRDWYNEPARRAAMFFLKNKFSTFLQFPGSYNAAQLALFIKRHEDILMLALPIPNNPSYDTAFTQLTQLLKKSAEIIKQHDLESIL